MCLLIEVVAARRTADIVCHSLTQEQDAIYSRSIVREKKKKMTQTNYTREIADAICSRMSEGESLRAICRDPGMPSEGTVVAGPSAM